MRLNNYIDGIFNQRALFKHKVSKLTIILIFIGLNFSAFAQEPTVQISNFLAEPLSSTSALVYWDLGNGDETIVVAIQDNGPPLGVPVDGLGYISNSQFGFGDQLGAGEYIVYSGPGTSVTVTGLNPNTNYSFAGYTYNSVGFNYLTTTPGNTSVPTFPFPQIESANIAADNTYVDIFFNYQMWGCPAMGCPLSISDFQILFNSYGGTPLNPTISSITQTDGVSSLIGGEFEVRVFLNLSGSPIGVETIEIVPSGNTIYNDLDEVLPLTETTFEILFNDIGDAIPPEILNSDLFFFDNGAASETIEFNINEELDLCEGCPVTGFSTSDGVIASALYTGKGTTNTITLTSQSNNDWTALTTVSYSSITGNVLDLALNELIDFNNFSLNSSGPPANFTVGFVYPLGGLAVADYFSSLTTSFNIEVPIDNDPALQNGTIQMQVRKNGGAYVDLGPPANIPNIGVNQTVTHAASVIETVLLGLSDGDFIEFNAIIENVSAQQTVGTPSANVVFVDRTSPTVTGLFVSLSSILPVDISTLNFYLQISYDEPINQLLDPLIDWPVEDPTSTLTYNSTLWTDAQTHETYFDVINSSEDLFGIDIRVSDAYDYAGNPVNIYTAVNQFDIELAGPTITGYTLALDNSYVDVTFSEGVFSSGGASAVISSNFNLQFTQNAGTATGVSIVSVTNTSDLPLNGGETTVRFNLSITGIPDGQETIEITPTDGNSVFNSGNAPMSATQTTGAAFLNNGGSPGVLNYVSGSTSISSLTNGGPGQIVFTFEIDNSAGGNQLRIQDIVFRTGPNNTVADWTDVIEGAILNHDGGGSSGQDPAIIAPGSISIFNLENNVASTIGRIQTAVKTYTLSIWLKNPLLIDADGLDLDFQLNSTDILIISAGSINPSVINSSDGAEFNTIDVTATELVFIQQPPSTIGLNTVLTPTPEVWATDANGNLDLDWSNLVTVTNTDNLGMTNAPTSGSNGKVIFTGFQYTAAGDGTLTVDDGGLVITSDPVTVICPALVVNLVSLSDNTSCGSPNGSIELNVNGSQDLGTYSVVWYASASNTPGSEIPLETSFIISGLVPGSYTAEIFDSGSGCSVVYSDIISDISSSANITNVNTIDQTSCSTPNGSATVTTLNSGVVSDYTFEWFIDAGTTVSIGTTATITGQVAATIYLVATNIATSCTTPAYPVLITESAANPNITSNNRTDQTNCLPPNGGASVLTLDIGTVGDYTFAWYSDAGLTTPIAGAGTTETISGQPAGSVYVVATNNITSCPTPPYLIDIVDNTTTPNITNVNTTDRTNCGFLNGSATVTTLDVGAVGDYTFEWFSDAGATVSIGTTATITNQAAGTIYVVATRISTGCPTPTLPVVISETLAIPSITMTTSIDQTSCLTPDGSATVTGIDLGSIGDYTFAWYSDAGLTSLIAGAGTGPTISGQPAGTVYVEATNDFTSCPSAGTSIVIANSTGAANIISVNTVNETSCVSPNGSANVAALDAGTVGDYTYEWFSDAATTNSIGTTSTISNLAAGTFYVVGTRIATGCPTPARDVVISGSTFTPTFSNVNITDQTNCSPVNGGATVTAMTTGLVTDYSYEWFSDLSATNSIGTSSSITGIASGTIYLVATSISNGCQSLPFPVVIADLAVDPVIDPLTIVNQTNCPSPNGSATITGISSGALVDYTFTWYSNSGLTTVITTGESISNRLAGTVFVQAVNNITQCTSAALPVVILDETPTISVSASSTDNTSCDTNAYNGVLDFSSSGGGSAYSYTITAAVLTVPITINGATTAQQLTNLSPATYTITTTDDISGCQSSTTATITNASVPLTIAEVSKVDKISCETDDGSVSIAINGTSDLAPYTVNWYSGSDNTGTLLVETGLSLSNLAAGSYFVEVVETATSCSGSLLVTIADVSAQPVLTLQKSDNTSCLASDGIGSLTINGSTTIAGFSINWYEGIDNTGTLITSDVVSYTQFSAGDYFVEVIDIASGCSASQTFTIADISTIPVIAVTSKTDNNSCSTPTGSATISIDGSTNAGGYSIAWKKNDNAIASNVVSVSALTSGTYTVEVTANGSDCKITETIVIADNIAIPASATLEGTTSTICDGGTQELLVSISGGTSPYTVELDNGVGTIINYSSGDPITVSPTATTTYKLLSVIDATGCSPTNLSTTGVKINVNPLPNPPSNLVFNNVTENSMRLAWTSGSGAGRVVIMKEGSAVDAVLEGGVAYTASSTFGSGQDLGNGNFVVFNALGTSVNIIGLTRGTDYYFAVYESNGLCYSLTSATANQSTTGCLPPDIVVNPLNQTICSGESPTIAFTSSDTDASFKWTTTASGVTGGSDGEGTTISHVLNGNGTITYTITPFTSETCEGTPVEVTVDVQSVSESYSLTGGGTICEGSGDRLIIGLDGSDTGTSYVLLRGGSTVETKVGTGSALNFNPTDISGEYTVSATTSAGCTGTLTGTVSITIDPAPSLNGNITGETAICQGEPGLVYSVTDPGNVEFNWTMPSGFTIVSGEGTASVTVDIADNAGRGSISVNASNQCGTTQSLTLPIDVSLGFDASIMAEEEIFASRPTSFSIESSETISSALWDFGDTNLSSNINASNTYSEPGAYSVSAELETPVGCRKIISINIEVQELAKIVIKNMFTPNDDGLNDILWIDNLSVYPQNEVVVLDRWGVEVANFINYQNDWDFKNEGDFIPAGNYLCIVRIEGDSNTYSMAINVIRERR